MGLSSLKPPMSYAQQMEKLRSRGCEISDESECCRLLSCINYYRLSAYFLPFKQTDDHYKPGTNLTTIFRIYEFDRKMRHLIFSAVEETEVNLRTKIAYFHAHRYGASGYLNAKIFSKRHAHEQFIETIEREIKANRKRLFVEHHIKNYSGNFPIWVIVELFTFGTLSHFYADMTTQDQKYMAGEVCQSTDYDNLRSWLRCCTDLRNICAHYGRLYYHIFSARPAVPKGLNVDDDSKFRLFGALFALKQIYPDKEKWDIEFVPQMAALIEEYKNDIELQHIGFTPRWQQELSN